MRASGSRPSSAAFSSLVRTQAGGAVVEGGGVAGGHGAALAERRLQLRERLEGGVGARALVASRRRVGSPRRLAGGTSIGAICSANRPSSRSLHGPLVAAQGEGVLVLAGDAVALGDVLAGLAHGLGRVALRHARVDHPPAERGVVQRPLAAGQAALGLRQHPGRAAHGLDAPGEVDLALAEPDRARCLVDRLEARGAEAVDGDAGDLDRQAGEQRGHPGDVAVVLSRLVGGAHVDVGDLPGSIPERSTAAATTCAARSSGRTRESAPR